MTSSNHHDLVVDLLNEIKTSRDYSSKLFHLEQIREVILHRSSDIMNSQDILTDLFDFMIEKHSQIRRFLIKLAFELYNLNENVTLPPLVGLYGYLINDMNDNILLNNMVKNVSNVYSRAVLCIANLSNNKLNNSNSDPKYVWSQFSTLVNRLNELISTVRPDSLKVSVLKLLENEMLFGLPSPPAVTSDPRLARSLKKDTTTQSTSSDMKTAESISLHHPFINRNEIQREAEEIFSKTLLWASKGGPQNYSFSPSLMSSLGQIIANVASARPKNAGNAAKAITFMIQKGNVAHLMNGTQREYLARATHRLLRAASVYSNDAESKNLLQKLRESIQSLEALGLGSDPIPSNESTIAGKKRDLSTLQSGTDPLTETIEEDEDSEMVARRVSAIAALNAAEIEINNKKSGVISTGSTDEAMDGLGNKISIKNRILVIGEYTELPNSITAINNDITSVVKTCSSMKLVSIHSSSVVQLKASNTMKLKAATTTTEITQRPILQDSQEYTEISTFILNNLLYELFKIKINSETAFKVFVSLLIRMIKSILMDEVASLTNNSVELQIIQSIPSLSTVGKLTDNVPYYVNLPKPLWTFVSFILSQTQKRGNIFPTSNSTKLLLAASQMGPQQHHLIELPQKIEWLGMLCFQLFEHFKDSLDVKNELFSTHLNDDMEVVEAEDPTAQDPEQLIIQKSREVYNALCLFTLSRMIQIIWLKPYIKSFLLKLPHVPPVCVKLLNLLMFTGTKTSGLENEFKLSTPAFKRQQIGSKNGPVRGTKQDAMQLLGQLVFSSDELIRRPALNCLLWAAVGEDFETRSNAVNLLVNEIRLKEEWCQEYIRMFALHSLFTVVGMESIEKWIKSRKTPLQENEMSMETVDPIQSAYESFDQGTQYEGSFPKKPSVGTSGLEAIELFDRKMFHVSSQLCLYDIRLLTCLVHIYSIDLQYNEKYQPLAPTIPPTTSSAPAVELKSGSDHISYMSETHNPLDDTGESPATTSPVGWSVSHLIQSELRNILPVLKQNHSSDEIFATIYQAIDPFSRPLLDFSLEILFNDFNYPPTRMFLSFVIKKLTNQLLESLSSAMVDLNNEDFLLIMYLIGCFTSNEIESCLPRLVKILMSVDGNSAGVSMGMKEVERIKLIFERIVKSRPSPMSRSGLLSYLHRLDYESYGLKPKALVDTIAVCLNNKTEFTPDTIKDTLKNLLQDEVPSIALMRTAILSAQGNNELKKYVLTDVIPHLIRKKVWIISPKVWDGVILGAKSLAVGGFKSSENTFRALLGIPGAQLKALFKTAPAVKTLISKLLKSLSEEELQEVTSGRWVGLVTNDDQISQSESDVEKSKIIKELLN